MRREILWYLIAAAWWVDSALAWYNHRPRQALLACIFACCFFMVGFFLQRSANRRP
jgi:hypothetical protein